MPLGAARRELRPQRKLQAVVVRHQRNRRSLAGVRVDHRGERRQRPARVGDQLRDPVRGTDTRRRGARRGARPWPRSPSNRRPETPSPSPRSRRRSPPARRAGLRSRGSRRPARSPPHADRRSSPDLDRSLEPRAAGRDRIGELARRGVVAHLEQLDLLAHAARPAGTIASAASPPNQGSMSRSKSAGAPSGPGSCDSVRASACFVIPGTCSKTLARLVVLLGVGVGVQVRVGQRVLGDELDRVVGRRARVAARRLAGSAGTASDHDEGQGHDDASHQREALPGLDREAEPEPPRPPSDRPGNPPRHAPGRDRAVLDRVPSVLQSPGDRCEPGWPQAASSAAAATQPGGSSQRSQAGRRRRGRRGRGSRGRGNRTGEAYDPLAYRDCVASPGRVLRRRPERGMKSITRGTPSSS